jgi:hypothetical protein
MQKKEPRSKKQLTVKQRKGETVLRKIKNALGDTAAKIKTFLPGKSGANPKRNDTVIKSDQSLKTAYCVV